MMMRVELEGVAVDGGRLSIWRAERAMILFFGGLFFCLRWFWEKGEEEEEEDVVINIQKEVGCNECSFCGFAFRKIDNDMESSFLSLSLFLSSHLLYVSDEQV